VGAAGQIVEGVGRTPGMVYVTVGGENTQLPFYADNALGFDIGASYQASAMRGAEFRVSAYPFSAQYVQMGFTGGYRIARQTVFGFPYTPFVYLGGGLARSQDKGTSRTGYPPTWQPCWQADLGFDRTYQRFSWRVVQVSWRETYALVNNLRSVGLSTGIVYHFQR
jgi:hypothetical protein